MSEERKDQLRKKFNEHWRDNWTYAIDKSEQDKVFDFFWSEIEEREITHLNRTNLKFIELDEPILEYTDPILAITPPCSQLNHSDKQGAEDFWNKIIYTQHLESGDEAYVIEKDDFLQAMQEYAKQERQRINDLLEEIDFFLALEEDSAHGDHGRRITELRGKIQEKLKESSKK